MNFSLTRIGSNQVALSGDTSLTPRALEKKTIVVEHDLMEIPEVRKLSYGDVVWDVGAYIGETAIVLGRGGAHVVGFEPQFDAFVCACFNTRMNGNIQMRNLAAGDGRKVSLGNKTLDDMGNLGTRSVSEGEDVDTVKLDTIPATRLDFVKIDCEGFEPAVLSGMMRTIRKFMPDILVEVFPEMLEKHGYDPSDIFIPMRELGYSHRIVCGVDTDRKYDVLFTIKTPLG